MSARTSQGTKLTFDDQTGFSTEEAENCTTITDPGNAGAIPVTKGGSVALVSAGAETRTLAAPTHGGQILNIYFKTDAGNIVITVAAAFITTMNTITFADAGDSITLIGVYNGTALVWRLLFNDIKGAQRAPLATTPTNINQVTPGKFSSMLKGLSAV